MLFARLVLVLGVVGLSCVAVPVEARHRRQPETPPQVTTDTVLSLEYVGVRHPPRRSERHNATVEAGSSGISVENPVYTGTLYPENSFGSREPASGRRPTNNIYGSGHPGIIGW